MAKAGRKPLKVVTKKTDVNGNKLRGRPSFDHTAPVVDETNKLKSSIESLSVEKESASFFRDKLPELYQEIPEPKEALKAYIKHMIMMLYPTENINIYAARVCPNRHIINLLYRQNLAEMTFDFRSQDKIQLEGYFRQILEAGMHTAIMKGDLKSFFSGAKLMKDLFGIETRKIIRAEVAGKSVSEIFGREFIDICKAVDYTEDENNEE